jgi:hypothetical protein
VRGRDVADPDRPLAHVVVAEITGGNMHVIRSVRNPYNPHHIRTGCLQGCCSSEEQPEKEDNQASDVCPFMRLYQGVAPSATLASVSDVLKTLIWT